MIFRGVPVALLLLGCSGGARDAAVSFVGRTPYGAMYADTREVRFRCPSCAVDVPWNAPRCPAGTCGVALRFPAQVPCGFCDATKMCDPCAAFGIIGVCRFCFRSGRLEPFGACFNCEGTGACVACAGSIDCDSCGGNGVISLPWKPVKSMPQLRRHPSSAPPRPDRFVVWLGEAVTWTAPKSDWEVRIAGKGRLSPAGEGRADSLRFQPVEPGSYVVTGAGAKLYFEVVELAVRRPGEGPVGMGLPLEAWLDPRPALQGAVVRWERVKAGAPALVLEGTRIAAPAAGPGRHELLPTVEIPGLPGRLGPRAVIYDVVELTVAGRGPVRAGVPVTLQAVSKPPLPEGTSYEWTVEGLATQVTTVPRTRIVLPRAGAFLVKVRAGAVVSPPLHLAAFAVSLQGEARIGGDRLRVAVDDPAAGAPASVAISTKRRDGTPLNAPVTYALGAGRATGPFMLVGDRADDAEGGPDDAPEDPTLLGAAGGTVEVSYRGAPVLSAPMGPVILHAVGVRFTVVRGPRDTWAEGELGAALDRRLERANEVWERFGLRFVRESLEVGEAPRNLAMVSGRAAGVDERGRPGHSGFVAGGQEVFVPTAWPMTPVSTARALPEKLGPGWTLDLFERLFPSAPEAVVLKLARKDGARAVLGPLASGRDASQSVWPLEADLSDGCEVSAQEGSPSVEELALLLGARRPGERGLDVVVVGEVRSGDGRPSFKAYPEGPFARSAIVSWAVLDGTGRYPYALGRVLGELLLPRSFRPSPACTLFEEPLSEEEGFGARKRVDGATGAAARARGVNLATGP